MSRKGCSASSEESPLMHQVSAFVVRNGRGVRVTRESFFFSGMSRERRHSRYCRAVFFSPSHLYRERTA